MSGGGVLSRSRCSRIWTFGKVLRMLSEVEVRFVVDHWKCFTCHLDKHTPAKDLIEDRSPSLAAAHQLAGGWSGASILRTHAAL